MLELQRASLLRVYQSLPVASCLINRALEFLAVNQRYADLMRMPQESIVGRCMVGLNPPEHIENVRNDFRVFDLGGMIPDHEIELWDGTYLVCVCPLRRVAGGPVAAISVTLTNITRNKRLEKELNGLVSQLTLDKEEIRRLSETDALTEIGNRRSFDMAMKRMLQTTRRTAEPLSLLIIDVDHFKDYNDCYGHLAGDDCLRYIARSIRDTLRRPDDIAARFGGEEFVVLLPFTAPDAARGVAEAIREQIARLRIAHTGSPHRIVTVSIGLAWCGPDTKQESDEIELTRDILAAADAALYRAKLAGRNQVLPYVGK